MVDGKFYAIGGRNGTTGFKQHEILPYDEYLDIWAFSATGESSTSSVSLNGKIYVLGGFGSSDYDELL